MGLSDDPGAASARFEAERRIAVAAAEDAGALLRAGAGQQPAARAKSGTGDLVTQLDLAAEQLIVGRIRAAFPDHQIIAEESGQVGADSRWTWLVDPLDGTNNLVIGLSTYVVGIALCRDRVPVLGVVHDPVAGQTWWAVRGAGGYGPGGPLPRREPFATDRPVLAWTQGHHVSRDDGYACALKLVLEFSARRVLQLWAPLLSWVMLARGDIDGIVGYRPEAIDLPAGALIAREAGMRLCGLDGEPFDDRIGRPAADRSFVAATPKSIGWLLELARTAEAAVPNVKELCSGQSADLG
jgi:myo-inositol-1(or 4)-monophosphatase